MTMSRHAPNPAAASASSPPCTPRPAACTCRAGIESLFVIQAKTLDLVIDGNDVVGRARTGCGKTLAFVLPVVQSLLLGPDAKSLKRPFGRKPSVLVLAPTRELAKQARRRGSLPAPSRALGGEEAAAQAAR